MPLNPYVNTSNSEASADAVNALRSVTVKLIAPCANALVVGARYTFTNLAEAVAILGSDFSKGNIAIKAIEAFYKSQDQVKVEYFYPGRNVASVTTTDIDEATTGVPAGTRIFDLTSAASFSVGDYITIGTGNIQEYRKILAKTSNTITVNALDFDHADAEAVVKITQFTIGGIDTCLTAAETVDGETLLVDKSEQKLAEITQHLIDIEANEIFTLAFVGYPFGKTQAEIIVDATANNDKHMVFNFGIPQSEETNHTFEGVMLAARTLIAYGKKMGEQRLENTVVKSMNNIRLVDTISVKDNDDDQELIESENNALVNGHVTACYRAIIDSVNSWRVYKMVTSYNEDVNGFPSTTYSNIIDPSGEHFMRRDFPKKVREFLGILNEKGQDLTTNEKDQAKVLAFLQAIQNKYDFLDGGQSINYIVITGVSGNELVFKVQYKLVQSADQLSFNFAKVI